MSCSPLASGEIFCLAGWGRTQRILLRLWQGLGSSAVCCQRKERRRDAGSKVGKWRINNPAMCIPFLWYEPRWLSNGGMVQSTQITKRFRKTTDWYREKEVLHTILGKQKIESPHHVPAATFIGFLLQKKLPNLILLEEYIENYMSRHKHPLKPIQQRGWLGVHIEHFTIISLFHKYFYLDTYTTFHN